MAFLPEILDLDPNDVQAAVVADSKESFAVVETYERTLRLEGFAFEIAAVVDTLVVLSFQFRNV